MMIADLAGKKIVILGFGREGMVTLDVLRRELRDATIMVTDELNIEGVPEFVALDAAVMAADRDTVVIKSPGIPWHRSYVAEFQAKGAMITSATNLFFAERKGRGLLIGVTGTKGKSTTTSLLAHVLGLADKPVRLVGNIGAPMLAHVGDPDDTIFVIELSSYMLADLEVGPDIAVLLNLYDEHMDYHGSVAAYHEAKWRIALKQNRDDLFVFNGSIPEIAAVASGVPAERKIDFTKMVRPDQISKLDFPLKGEHNKQNAMAVYVVARHLGIPDETIARAFASFVPLPHRLEEVATVDGITYVNDSISTTPQSALAAIDVYADHLGAVLLGGKDRGYDFTGLAIRLRELPNARPIILPGGQRIALALENHGIAFERAESLEQAVAWCKSNLHEGQVCLLSPASPSYGYFKNFEARGEAFKKAILSLNA